MRTQITEGFKVRPEDLKECLTKVTMFKAVEAKVPTSLLRPGGQSVTATRGDYIYLDDQGEYNVMTSAEFNARCNKVVMVKEEVEEGKFIDTEVIDATSLDVAQTSYLMNAGRKVFVPEHDNAVDVDEETKEERIAALEKLLDAAKKELAEKVSPEEILDTGTFQEDDFTSLSKIKKNLLADMATKRKLTFEYKSTSGKDIARMIIDYDVALTAKAEGEA